jgi:hypothetical protein
MPVLLLAPPLLSAKELPSPTSSASARFGSAEAPLDVDRLPYQHSVFDGANSAFRTSLERALRLAESDPVAKMNLNVL